MKLIKSKKKVSLEDLPLLVKELKILFQKPQVLLLDGDLGTGKTTFTHFLLATFPTDVTHPSTTSPQSKIKAESTFPLRVAGSPAFSIQHVYPSSYGLIHHVDLYRLKDSEDLESTGFWDIFSDRKKTYLVILEWADRLNPACLPLGWNYIKVHFLFGKTNNTRNITVFT